MNSHNGIVFPEPVMQILKAGDPDLIPKANDNFRKIRNAILNSGPGGGGSTTSISSNDEWLFFVYTMADFPSNGTYQSDDVLVLAPPNDNECIFIYQVMWHVFEAATGPVGKSIALAMKGGISNCMGAYQIDLMTVQNPDVFTDSGFTGTLTDQGLVSTSDPVEIYAFTTDLSTHTSTFTGGRVVVALHINKVSFA